MHAFPAIDPGKLTVARFFGLLDALSDLPATVVTPPPEYGWMEASAAQTDARLSIELLAPDYHDPTENYLG